MQYEEDQRGPMWFGAAICVFMLLIGVIAALMQSETPWIEAFMSACGPVLLIGLFFWAFTLRTTVDKQHLSLSLFRLPPKKIPLTDIQSAFAVEYSPFRDFGGWGWRLGPKGTMYSASGNRAVELKLKSGKTIFVGSSTPQKLVAALQR